MISPKYHQILQKKAFNSSKTQLEGLKSDVERSRIAVENITTFQAAQGRFKQKIDDLQYQLQSCITNINLQAKRNKVLNQLISVLKGEMFKYQATKKKQEQAEQVKKDKQINKFQYQIDQILQKHNQQVAKIHNLKQLANSRRSERVVYSNLFKKLERQIKHYEQIYKEQLIISRIAKSKPNKSVSMDTKGHATTVATEGEEKKKNIQDIVKKNYQQRYSVSKGNTPAQAAWNGFITSNNKQQNTLKPPNTMQNKKFHTINEDERQQLKSSAFREDKLTYTKDVLKQISEYTNLVQKIKIHAECSSIDEIFDHYEDIDQQNKTLLAKISACDQKIQILSDKQQKITKKINEQEVAKKLTMIPHLLTASQIAGFHVNEASNRSNESQISKLNQDLIEISIICGIELDLNKNKIASNQSLKLLDEKISSICNQFCNNSYQGDLNKREDTIISETIVDCLLQKMDKFNNCQRILDRGLFRQEYYKQLNKRRPTKAKR